MPKTTSLFMKLKSLYLIITLCFFVLLTSCLGKEDEEDIALSSDASFVSLTFAASDSTPGLDKAVFTLESDTLIVNTDSLPFNSRLDKAIARFYFASSSKAYIYFGEKDSVELKGNDTLNLSGSNKESRIVNISGNKEDKKTYRLKINVHTREGEAYVWKRVQENIGNSTGNQKAVFFNNSYLYYFVDATDIKLIASNGNNLSNWKTAESISSLPTNTLFWYLAAHNGELFVPTQDNLLFKSADGKTWEEVNYTTDNNLKIHSLIFSLKGNLLAIAKTEANVYHIISSIDGTTWNDAGRAPDNFPIEDYSALVFQSLLNNLKGIILGGKNASGSMTQIMNWSTSDGINWVNLGKENKSLGTLTGGTLVQYDKKLFLLGGMDSQNQTRKNILMESKDQGLTWQVPDSTYNVFPNTFPPRSYMSSMLSTDTKEIILIGGKEHSVYSDVWTGRINKIDFLNK